MLRYNKIDNAMNSSKGSISAKFPRLVKKYPNAPTTNGLPKTSFIRKTAENMSNPIVKVERVLLYSTAYDAVRMLRIAMLTVESIVLET
jgi:hypothetical protein